MPDFDEEVLKCFLENQLKLFPEEVAFDLEEAEDFLTECMAVVLDGPDEVYEYFVDEGVDLEDYADKTAILEADEVFDVGDGRYLIVEA